MDRGRVLDPAALMLAAATMALTACGGGNGGDGADDMPPFDMQTGVVAADLDGDGHVDVAIANTYVAGPPPHPVRLWLYFRTVFTVLQAGAIGYLKMKT